MEFYSIMIDHIDEKILSELKHNAKQTTGTIAKRTGIPTTTVHNRIKRMEKERVIRSYRPVIDYQKIGLQIHAIVFVSAEQKTDQEHLAKKLLHLPGIERAQILTGSFDLLLDVKAKSIDELNELVVKELRKINGIAHTQTMIVLQELE